MKLEELDLNDYRVNKLQRSLVRGSKVLRVFRVRNPEKPRSTKYEVHYLDPANGLCKTVMASREKVGGR